MAVARKRSIRKYPYSGAFYSYEVDFSLPLNQRLPQETLVEAVRCDIQRQGARHNGGMLGAGYKIKYPLAPNPEWDGEDASEQYLPIKVRRGMTFRGGEPLYPVEGEVEFVRFSQLGVATIDIKVKTETAV